MQKVNLLLYQATPDLLDAVNASIKNVSGFDFSFFNAHSFHDFTSIVDSHPIHVAFINFSESQDNDLQIEELLAYCYDFPLVKIIIDNNPSAGLLALKQGFQDFIFKSQLNSYQFEKIIIHAIGLIQALAKLQEKEGRYRRMFEDSKIGIYLSTSDGKLIEVNKAFARIFGYNTPDEAIKQIDNTGNHLYANPNDRIKLIKALKSQEVEYHQVELKFRRKDGSSFMGLLNMRPIQANSQSMFMVEGYIQDISDKNALENKIHETLQFLREILDNIPGPVFSKDINLRYTGCNKEFERYIGFSEKEIIGKKLLDLRKDELALLAHNKDLELRASGEPQKFEHKIIFADGSIRDAVFHKNIFRNRKGEFNGIIGLILDTTEEKLALRQLQEELSLNKALTELSKELIKPGTSISDISNRVITFAKEVTHSKLGYAGVISPESEELVIYSYSTLNPDEFPITGRSTVFQKIDGRYPHLWGHSLNTLQPFFTNMPHTHEKSGGVPEGHAGIINYLSVPAMINGRLVGQIALANSDEPYNNKDVEKVTKLTHLFSLAIQKQRSVDELIKAKEKAEESDELKSAFLANMSHEIRTPLNAIVGFAQLLGDPNILNEEINEFKATIINNTNILLKLINDIIEMAMIEAGELRIHLEERNINELMDNIFITWTSRDEYVEAADKIKFLLEKPQSDANPEMLTDPIRFNQIFDNLLMNAFRFTQKGKITLGYHFPKNDTVEFYVRDTGIGIGPEFMKTIFERFRQEDELKVRNFSGTGLGLAITKKFTEHLSGSIRIESKLGEGSSFYLTFPLLVKKTRGTAPQIIKENIPREHVDEESKLKSKSILIVEDNDANYEFLEVLLHKKGAVVQRAVDGKVAIELALKRNFDIVLMDLQLPRLSGFDAIKGIREINRDLPIIVQTAFSHSDERRKAFEAGCDAYLIKPLTSKKLLSTILKFF